MKRNLKALGLALVAAFAMSAVVASAAQAESQGNFKADAYPAVVTGHEEGGPTANFFQVTGANGPRTHCAAVTYEGTAVADSTKLTITPHYTSCQATNPNFGATVDLNGCHYIFEAGTKTSATDVHGSVQVVCPAGQGGIEVTVGGICGVTVTPQTVTGGVTFTNVPNGDVTVDVTINEKLHYVETDLNFLCPNTNNHTTTNGSFTSSVLVTGFKDLGNHAGVTVDPDGTEWPKTTYTEGTATDISVG